MRRLRILIASTHRALVGGIETYLRDLIPSLRQRGHEIGLFCEHLAPAGNMTIDDAMGPAWWAGGGAVDELIGDVAAWGPDVVFSQGQQEPHLEEALLQAFPAVLFAHGYHGTCISGSKRHVLPWAEPCTRVFGAGCLACYFPRRCGGLNPRSLLRQYRLERQRNALLQRYRAIAVASRHMREEYLRHGVPAERVVLLPLFPPGTVPDTAPPVSRPLTGTVLFVGRLINLKGGALLIRAVAAATRALGRTLRLAVAGDGPELASLQRLAQRQGVPAQFYGWVDAARREQLMRQADLLAVPSVWPEPFGLVGLEAACVGLPAVAFAVGGIPDWLRPGVSGELAPGDPPTVAGLAAAIARALADPERLARLGAEAWRLAARFTREQHVRDLERLLGAHVRAGPKTISV